MRKDADGWNEGGPVRWQELDQSKISFSHPVDGTFLCLLDRGMKERGLKNDSLVFIFSDWVDHGKFTNMRGNTREGRVQGGNHDLRFEIPVKHFVIRQVGSQIYNVWFRNRAGDNIWELRIYKWGISFLGLQ